ncbi:hypothetical protein KQX54_013294 [Cotesia glomerata]|uniref:Endonuclease/exonuclease/phosphatase domain-containing protein n=1 Tax=Cotesia glomerata TaxID=32391 RepID=A0AAV7I7D1_COTGL|nr:hypothetical protein KQX54_013294 [Cotesia glomerata]
MGEHQKILYSLFEKLEKWREEDRQHLDKLKTELSNRISASNDENRKHIDAIKKELLDKNEALETEISPLRARIEKAHNASLASLLPPNKSTTPPSDIAIKSSINTIEKHLRRNNIVIRGLNFNKTNPANSVNTFLDEHFHIKNCLSGVSVLGWSPATKPNNQLGHASGGLVSLVHSSAENQILHSSHHWIISKVCTCNLTIIATFVYISPDTDLKKGLEELQTIIDEICESPTFDIFIIAGDFNKRLGSLGFLSLEDLNALSLFNSRSSLDNSVNQRELGIKEACTFCNMNSRSRPIRKPANKPCQDQLAWSVHFNNKIEYFALLKMKKEEYHKQIRIQFNNVNNPKEFWKAIKTARGYTSRPVTITIPEWEKFYANMFPPRSAFEGPFSGSENPELDSTSPSKNFSSASTKPSKANHLAQT